MADADAHQPVLLDEVLAGLSIRPDGLYLDATFGRGGHSRAILDRLGNDGRLYVLDRDPQAVAVALELAGRDPRLAVRQANFADLRACASDWALLGRVDGLLLDLGVSSPQLDDAGRGFGFLRDGPLDMRMDPHTGASAAQWLARADEGEIADVLWRYGEERQSRRIARAIVADREQTPFTRTRQLAELIARVCRTRAGTDRHPATRSFQAIRSPGRSTATTWPSSCIRWARSYVFPPGAAQRSSTCSPLAGASRAGARRVDGSFT